MRHYDPRYIPANHKSEWTGKAYPARTQGKDGKWYPGRCQRCAYTREPKHGYTSTLIMAALRQARYGLRKAGKLACESGIEDRDLAALDALAAQAQEMAAWWHTAVEPTQAQAGA